VFFENGPFISITFDDAYDSVYNNALDLMNKYEYRGVVFIVAGLIGEYLEGNKLLNIDQILHLQKIGWDIGCHSYSHPYSITSLDYNMKQYHYEIKYSKEKLEELGLIINDYAYPFGTFDNEKYFDIVKENYRYARTGLKGINKVRKRDHELKSIDLSGDAIEVKKWIDLVSETKGWLILYVHGVETGLKNTVDVGFHWTRLEILEEVLNYINIKEIPVMTFNEVYDAVFG
jgi:peptidoglycan/xylan/chitin deacetylase (PgdA/CDA1 family)